MYFVGEAKRIKQLKMTQFLALNLLDYDLDSHFMKLKTLRDTICVCCLNQRGAFAFINNCYHADFLQDLLKHQENYEELLICSDCHIFAKKVYKFIRQVEANLSVLDDHLQGLEINIIQNRRGFSIKKLPNMDLPPVTTVPLITRVAERKDLVSEKSPAMRGYSIPCAVKTTNNFNKNNVNNNINIPNRSPNPLPNQRHDTFSHTKMTSIQQPVTKNELLSRLLSRNPVQPKISNRRITAVRSSPLNTQSQPTQIIATNYDEAPFTHTFVSTNQDMSKVEVSVHELDIKSETVSDSTIDAELAVSVVRQSKEVSKVAFNHTNTQDKEASPPPLWKNPYPPLLPEEAAPGIKEITLTMEEVLAQREAARERQVYKEKEFKCEDCILSFDYEETLKSHIERIHERHKSRAGSTTCDICKSVCKHERAYRQHYLRHYRRYECIKCGIRNATLRWVEEHIVKEHDPNADVTVYTCRKCDYTSKFLSKIRYHREWHKIRVRGRVSCEQCGKQFANNSHLNSHKISAHKKTSKNYKCDECGKMFHQWRQLRLHSRVAHGDGDEEVAFCAPCGKHFHSQNSLKTHLAKHSAHTSPEDKKYICDTCGNRYIDKTSLKKHIKHIHLKLAEHQCTKCSKRFPASRQLKLHISYVHDKVRPPRNHVCHLCGNAFYMKTILESHIRTHTGERPLHCPECGKDFAHKAALYTHRKLVHKRPKQNQ